MMLRTWPPYFLNRASYFKISNEHMLSWKINFIMTHFYRFLTVSSSYTNVALHCSCIEREASPHLRLFRPTHVKLTLQATGKAPHFYEMWCGTSKHANMQFFDHRWFAFCLFGIWMSNHENFLPNQLWIFVSQPQMGKIVSNYIELMSAWNHFSISHDGKFLIFKRANQSIEQFHAPFTEEVLSKSQARSEVSLHSPSLTQKCT